MTPAISRIRLSLGLLFALLTLADQIKCSTPELRQSRCRHSANSHTGRSSPQLLCPEAGSAPWAAIGRDK